MRRIIPTVVMLTALGPLPLQAEQHAHTVPPGDPHYAWVGDAETVVRVHGVGPTDLRFVRK